MFVVPTLDAGNAMKKKARANDFLNQSQGPLYG